MTLDNMTGITEGSYTGFCKSQLITCNRVKECNGVCPFEDALKHADKMQTMNEQHTVDHDREWIIGCIKHDGFIKTDRFDKANQIILDAIQFAEHFDLLKEHESLQEVVRCKDCRHLDVWNLKNIYAVCSKHGITFEPFEDDIRTHFCSWGERR